MNAFFLRPRPWQDEHRMCSTVFMKGRSCICDWSKNFSSSPSTTETKTICISIHQISEQQFSRLLIGSRNSEYPWIFTVLGRVSKWLLVSWQFQKITFVRKIKQLHQQIPRKRQHLACRCLQVDRKKNSCWICNKILKIWSPKHCQLKHDQTLTSDVFYLQKVPFWFLFNWFGKYKNSYPPQEPRSRCPKTTAKLI